jgi:mono/diheme cytochrome c family protein
MAQGGGDATYKSKCAACHGAAGEGKVGPALKGTKLSEDEMVALVTKGKEGKKAPHSKAMSGLTEEQAKAVAQYVKSLK